MAFLKTPDPLEDSHRGDICQAEFAHNMIHITFLTLSYPIRIRIGGLKNNYLFELYESLFVNSPKIRDFSRMSLFV